VGCRDETETKTERLVSENFVVKRLHLPFNNGRLLSASARFMTTAWQYKSTGTKVPELYTSRQKVSSCRRRNSLVSTGTGFAPDHGQKSRLLKPLALSRLTIDNRVAVDCGPFYRNQAIVEMGSIVRPSGRRCPACS
jgi:hypothetical protein